MLKYFSGKRCVSMWRKRFCSRFIGVYIFQHKASVLLFILFWLSLTLSQLLPSTDTCTCLLHYFFAVSDDIACLIAVSVCSGSEFNNIHQCSGWRMMLLLSDFTLSFVYDDICIQTQYLHEERKQECSVLLIVSSIIQTLRYPITGCKV